MKTKSKLNPELEDLATLIGTWDMEISNASFLPDPSAKLYGTASFKWLEGGDFMIMRQGDKAKGPPHASWVIGRDEITSEYKMLYFDDRAVSRIYEMSFKNRAWKIWRKAPGFWQRFEGTLSKDKKTITAHWDSSRNGKKWEHDFDLTYTRAK